MHSVLCVLTPIYLTFTIKITEACVSSQKALVVQWVAMS